MAMIKQMLALTEPQVIYLQRESARLGITIPELLRRIIDSHRDKAS